METIQKICKSGVKPDHCSSDLAVCRICCSIGYFVFYAFCNWLDHRDDCKPAGAVLDEKIKIRRKAGSAIVIIAVIAAIVAGIYGILSLLAGQLKGFVEELPGLWKAMESDISNAGNSLESFSHYFSPNVQEQVARILNSLMKLLSSAVDHMGSPTVSAVGNFAKNIPTIIVGVIMCLLSSYFFVAQREEVIAAFRRYVPENFRKSGM